VTTTYDQSTVTYDQSTLTYQGLPAQFDGVAFAVEMAFGYEPLDTAPQWKVVTPYVRGFNIDRGKSSEFSTYSPGTASIALDNRDRRFDPEYTAGPYFGELNPMVPVRVQATYSGTTYTMFYGFVQGWPTVYNQSNTDAVATVRCIDANRLLGNTILPIEYEYLVSSDPSLALYLPLQTWESFVTVQGVSTTGILDYTKSTYMVRKSAISPTFTDESAPVQTNQGFRHDSSYSTAYTHTINQDFMQAIGRTPAIFSNEQDAFITGSMRTLEFWLYSIDATRWGAYTNETILLVNYRAPTGSYDSRISFSAKDDGTLHGIYFLTADGERDHTLSTTVDLVPQDANHIVMTADSTNVMIYVNGSQVYNEPFNGPAVSGVFAGPYVLMNVYTYVSRMSHVAVYYDTFDAAKVAEHYAAGYGYVGDSTSGRLTRMLDDVSWPAGFRGVETGVQTVGAYRGGGLSVRDYSTQIDGAEQGALFVNREGEIEFRSRSTADVANIVGLFDDSGTDLPFTNVAVDAHTVDAIRNNVIVNYANGSTVSEDSASIAAYGRATETLDAGLIDDDADAQSIGDNLLARTKDPRTRITRLDVNVRSDPAGIVPVVAALDLSDDVTVSLTPTGVGAALWRAVRVQGIQHTVTPETWDVALYLAPGPINTNGPLLVLNDDTYGELDNNKLG
jgi:hypothetical protein